MGAKNKANFKIYFAFFAIFIFLLTTGLGCKGMSAEQQQATKAVTLEYWTVYDDVDTLNKLIAEYRATRPYITVNLRQMRQEDLYARLTETLAEGKNIPNIISVHNRNLDKFVSKLAQMPAGVNDTTIITTKGTVGEKMTVQTTPRNLVSLAQLDQEYVKVVREDVVRSGKIYGLPLSVDTMAVFYNKDLLDRSGVAETPKTWDEFQAAVKKITKYDKTTGKPTQYGAAFGTGKNISASDDMLYILFKQSNVNFVSKDGRAVFNATGNSSAQILDFYTDYANNTRDTYAWDETAGDALDKFSAGSVGFLFGYSYNFPVIRSRAPQLDLRILPLFQVSSEDKKNVASYWIQSVVGKSENQNEAWALVDYLTHSKATKKYLDATLRPTALRAYITEQNTNLDLAPFVSNILIAENWYRGKDYAAAKKAVDDMISEWLQPIENEDKANEIRQEILNRAVNKINQTL